MAQQRKKKPAFRPRANLDKALKSMLRHGDALTDDQIKQLLADVVLDTADDGHFTAGRQRIRLEALMGMHKINQANRPKETTGVDDPGDDNDDNESFQTWKERKKNSKS